MTATQPVIVSTFAELNKALENDTDAFVIRALLIDPDEQMLDLATEVKSSVGRVALLREKVRTALAPLEDSRDWERRESLTALALSLSLCPLHLHDYAICFDDDVCEIEYAAECRVIRTIHPTHDS